jgi:hypothetical protein
LTAAPRAPSARASGHRQVRPVGAISFAVSATDAANFAVGDTVMVQRTATTQWLHDIGADQVVEPWTSRNVDMDRTIVRIDGNVITLDAPLTHAWIATTTTAAGRSASTRRPGALAMSASNTSPAAQHSTPRNSAAAIASMKTTPSTSSASTA